MCDCNICYEKIKQTDLYLCPNEIIKHEYHQECINKWKSTNHNKSNCCPVCNISLFPLDLPSLTLHRSGASTPLRFVDPPDNLLLVDQIYNIDYI